MRFATIVVAGLPLLAGCNDTRIPDPPPALVQVIDGCKVYRIRAHETYSGYVWTTICANGHAETVTTDGHGGKTPHREEVRVETADAIQLSVIHRPTPPTENRAAE